MYNIKYELLSILFTELSINMEEILSPLHPLYKTLSSDFIFTDVTLIKSISAQFVYHCVIFAGKKLTLYI